MMMSVRMASLAEAVHRRRLELGLRQADLAELGGCSQRFVSTLEQGKRTVRLDKLVDVLEVLGLELCVVPRRGDIESTHDAPPGAVER